MQAVAQGRMSGLLHASIAPDCFPLRSLLPAAKGIAAARVTWLGGTGSVVARLPFFAWRFEKLSNVLEQLQRLSTWNCFQRRCRGGRCLSQQWLLLQPLPVWKQMISDADCLPVLFNTTTTGPSQNSAQDLPEHAAPLQPENSPYALLLWCRHGHPQLWYVDPRLSSLSSSHEIAISSVCLGL